MREKPLAEPIKSGTADSVLSGLYRKILFDLNIDFTRFNHLTEQYIIRAGLARHAKETTSVRGNLKKELLHDRMSWKVFIKGLNFLRIVRFDITIRLYHHNHKLTEHTKSVMLYTHEDTHDQSTQSGQDSD